MSAELTRRTLGPLAAVAAACAALVPAAPALADGTAAGGCLPVAVVTTGGTYTYTVRIAAGTPGCGVARAVVRDAGLWPPAETQETAAWRCTVGRDPASWAISCTDGGAIVRAYGPVRARNPWLIAAAQLRIGVLAPGAVPGLVLDSVQPRPRCDNKGWLVADYTGAGGATLTIAEGRPHTCTNQGIAPILAVWRIHGQPARLIEFCSPTGCARQQDDYALQWNERGLQIVVLDHGLDLSELLEIARSLAPVPV